MFESAPEPSDGRVSDPMCWWHPMVVPPGLVFSSDDAPSSVVIEISVSRTEVSGLFTIHDSEGKSFTCPLILTDIGLITLAAVHNYVYAPPQITITTSLPPLSLPAMLVPDPSSIEWTDAFFKSSLEREGLYFSLETIQGWSVTQRQEAAMWLAEYDLRERDLAVTKIPYPKWLDHAPQDPPVPHG